MEPRSLGSGLPGSSSGISVGRVASRALLPEKHGEFVVVLVVWWNGATRAMVRALTNNFDEGLCLYLLPLIIINL